MVIHTLLDCTVILRAWVPVLLVLKLGLVHHCSTDFDFLPRASYLVQPNVQLHHTRSGSGQNHGKDFALRSVWWFRGEAWCASLPIFRMAGTSTYGTCFRPRKYAVAISLLLISLFYWKIKEADAITIIEKIVNNIFLQRWTCTSRYVCILLLSHYILMWNMILRYLS